MGVYTKTGDHGQTGLYSGERVDKASARVEAYGTVDEANSALAMARAFCTQPQTAAKILPLQKKLSLLMADLASIGREPCLTAEDVKAMEREIDEMESMLPPLQAFIVPGDTKGGAMLDLARTMIRRAERRFLELARTEDVHEVDRLFLNRSSDYCFMLMRLEENKE